MTHETNLHRDPEDTLDQLLRTELCWQAPPELSERLRMLAAEATQCEVVYRQEPVLAMPVGPRPWLKMLVAVLTIVAMTLSLVVAWYFYGALSVELGLDELWRQAQLLPEQWLAQAYTQMPALRTVVTVLGNVRDQLHWLLIAIVLWLALDGWSPRSFQQRRVSS
jgi:hypothetical protein